MRLDPRCETVAIGGQSHQIISRMRLRQWGSEASSRLVQCHDVRGNNRKDGKTVCGVGPISSTPSKLGSFVT